MSGYLGVFSRHTKYRVLGNTTSGFAVLESLSTRGTPAPRTILLSEDGVFFVARDGIFLTNFVEKDIELSQQLLPLFSGETVNDFLPINWGAIDASALTTYKRRLYFSYASGDSSTPDMVAVYSQDTRHWYFYEMDVSAFLAEEDTDLLTAGDSTGRTWIVEEGESDDGVSIESQAWTAERNSGEPLLRKRFYFLTVDASVPSGVELLVQVYIDGERKEAFTVTGQRLRKQRRMSADMIGHTWQLRLSASTSSGRIRFYGAEMYMEILRAD